MTLQSHMLAAAFCFAPALHRGSSLCKLDKTLSALLYAARLRVPASLLQEGWFFPILAMTLRFETFDLKTLHSMARTCLSTFPVLQMT